MTDAYIVGVDMIKFGRFPDRTVPQIGAQAALMALDDCGLKIQDMQALYCGNLGQASGMVGQRILQEIGQTGIPVVNVANACATGATAFREAWASVKAGLYDCVLAVGVEQMGKGLLGGAGGAKGISKEGLLGSGTMPAVFAEAGMEHARKYGTTFEQFAKVSVKNHHHSTLNPKAMYQIETPLEDGNERGDDLLPEHQADVFGQRRRLRRRGHLLGSQGEGTRPHESRRQGPRLRAWRPTPGRNATSSCRTSTPARAARRRMPTRWPASDADDIDLVELHDCFATAEILHYENLGLCKPTAKPAA